MHISDNSQILVIGCGNNYKDHYKYHSNFFTIDQNEKLKPSFVYQFGKEYLTNISNNSFDTIIFEGLFPFAIDSNIGINELKRISKKYVNIQVTIIENNEIIILSKRKKINCKDINKNLLYELTKESEKAIEKLEFK